MFQDIRLIWFYTQGRKASNIPPILMLHICVCHPCISQSWELTYFLIRTKLRIAWGKTFIFSCSLTWEASNILTERANNAQYYFHFAPYWRKCLCGLAKLPGIVWWRRNQGQYWRRHCLKSYRFYCLMFASCCSKQ